MDLGTTLRGARERRGLSLPELARITKIKIDTLRAIESDAFDRLPGGIFTRGFLRSYAREVGVDPEDAVRRYREEFEIQPAVAQTVPVSTRHEYDRNGVTVSGGRAARLDVGLAIGRYGRTAAAVLALAVVGYLTFVATRHRDRSPAVAPAAPVVARATPALPAPAPAAVGTSGTALQLALTAQAPCWISATADGKRTLFKIMQPGERQSLQVRDELVLRVGEPAALEYSINGAPGRTLGRSGEPVTVRITPANYREFLGKPAAAR
jgi:cytoskeleton protein RodZ